MYVTWNERFTNNFLVKVRKTKPEDETLCILSSRIILSAKFDRQYQYSTKIYHFYFVQNSAIYLLII